MRTEWSIEFYVDGRGGNPVLSFLEGATPAERAMVDRTFRLLEEFGVRMDGAYCRHVEGKLWELRPGGIRVFYFAHTGRRLVMLHAYRKKSRKAPRSEVAIAMKRLEEIRGRLV